VSSSTGFVRGYATMTDHENDSESMDAAGTEETQILKGKGSEFLVRIRCRTLDKGIRPET
jgi:hypothetical protein